MHDFFGEYAEKVQNAGQRCWICAESVDDIFEDVLPLGHLYRQVRQTHAQLQPGGLRSCMEQGQVPHDGCPELRQLCAGHLVEVIYDLALLDKALSWDNRNSPCPSVWWQRKASLQRLLSLTRA